MSEGIVFLVGAGPGDPGLLTVRGAELLASADVLVYDVLANPTLLALAPEQAERIFVGKRAGDHSRTQDEINALLVEHARAGRRVVRLKGGDPFVFGRGGEEAEVLEAAGIPFEIVPGITSAIAAPAYAGVPVTHRDAASAFVVVTGHEAPDKDESTLDYDALARLGRGATLVFLMGVRRLPQIAASLIERGLPAETPALTTRWGTMPRQRSASGTLATIADEVARAGIEAPAVTVIGEVARYRERLRWFDLPARRPLLGKRVVVTRARAQASELSAALRALGAEPVELPTIRIEPPADGYAALDRAIGRIDGYDWILFTSTNGVDHFWRRLEAARLDSRALGRARVGAIGSATADALARRGIRADLVPPRYVAESLLEALTAEPVTGRRFLLPRADIARPALREGLIAAGAEVDEPDAYRTVVGAPDPTVLAALDQGVDIITLTSSSTARNFVEMLGGERARAIAGGATVVAIGPITASTARELGLRVDIVAETHTIPGMIDAIVRGGAPSGLSNEGVRNHG